MSQLWHSLLIMKQETQRIRSRMIDRATNLAERRNHFVAHPFLGVVALAYYLPDKEQRKREYTTIDTEVVRRLAAIGIESEIYIQARDFGQGRTYGRQRLLVQSRDGQPTNEEYADVSALPMFRVTMSPAMLPKLTDEPIAK